MLHINNNKKQRRHLRTIERFEEIEATIESGAACCGFPRHLCKDVPTRQCAESPRGKMFRTCHEVAHEGIRTIERSTENEFTSRLTGAVATVQKILLAVSRLAETDHQVQFTRTARMHCE